ncbi:endoribonuclease [Sulfodiicoccus acidiphilus]|uniref:Endoribonuclease n=1 Tax=Sulfodiicoccus acidiphilus TaxID=1670455 RepID=A0A348B283_9CREN|nr:RidA family protein [Sulfodiicoccus acidiphilus]BBD72285.1 endoribonuclease [Sulfodiicoccus acidiphilus]GGT90540.1 endoribonuclease [Sulfodiicoccus acidiphilus]
MKKVVRTTQAPTPIGPYSQAVDVGETLFISGQIPVDPSTNELVRGGIREQTERVMENLKAVLDEAGLALEDVVMTFVYLVDLKDFNDYNEVYGKYFKQPPARVTVQVSALPRGAKIEVAAIAHRS